ncbi:MAG: HD domain-containing protein [Bacteriovoracaceae bacterium]|nr:HD domain-containing protein [Bacteriovoracaceae bacterium]
MDKKQYVTDLAPKGEVDSIFLVKYIAKMDSRDGKNYLNVILADSTGDVEARKWHGAEKVIEAVAKGDYVGVKGKVNLYQGRHQVIVSSITKLSPEDVQVEEFVPKSKTSPDIMFDELDGIIDSLNDVYIKDLLKAIVHDGEIQRRLKLWAAGKSIHHAYQGGLLEHILGCTKLAVSLCEFYPVNRNYVIAGTVLHDLCKIYELTDGAMVEYTEEGKLVGHLIGVVELFDRYAAKIPHFPHTVKLHLKHILVSHHGEYEYGSPKIPQTSEALLVHQIDLLDSKMHSFEAVKKQDKQPGHWSGYVKHLDRIVFKGELPTHKEYVKEDRKLSEKGESNTAKKSGPTGELKQNLGGLLKDFKVE